MNNNTLSVQKRAEQTVHQKVNMGFEILVEKTDEIDPIAGYLFFGDLGDEITDLFLKYGDEIKISITR